jgi:hypothetical protein
MRWGNNAVLAALVLLFLAAHFLLLAGILIRIVLTQWRRMRIKTPTNQKTLRSSSTR